MTGLRVFVCEFVTGGGFVDTELPAGLHREGDMMLRALVKDLSDAPGVGVVLTRDHRLPKCDLPAEIRTIEASSDPWSVWRESVANADALWPIAPETGGILERLSTLAVVNQRILLGSPPQAIRVTASKRQSAALLASRGVAVAPTVSLDAALADGVPPSAAGWVVKPDDGAGAQDTFFMRRDGDIHAWSSGRHDLHRFVVQPYLPGPAASLSLLCRTGTAALLSCNSQDVRLEDGRFRYHGGIVGGREAARALFTPIAAHIAAALPDLWGYVGVDLVETADGPVVLEINPRLTTSYVGLRAALGVNPAELVLQLLVRGSETIALPPHVGEYWVKVDGDEP